MKKKNKLYKDICNNKLINHSDYIKRKCRALRAKVKSIVNDKELRKKIVAGTVIFILVNLIIVLLVTKTSVVPKVVAYIGKKIYAASKPEHKEIATKVQEYVPVVVEFAERYGPYFKTANKIHAEASNIYKSVAEMVTSNEIDTVVPGSFSENNNTTKQELPVDFIGPLPEKKLDEGQAISLINALFFGFL